MCVHNLRTMLHWKFQLVSSRGLETPRLCSSPSQLPKFLPPRASEDSLTPSPPLCSSLNPRPSTIPWYTNRSPSSKGAHLVQQLAEQRVGLAGE